MIIVLFNKILDLNNSNTDSDFLLAIVEESTHFSGRVTLFVFAAAFKIFSASSYLSCVMSHLGDSQISL